MVSSSDDAITILGMDGRFTHWNPGATRLYGWSAEEALGRHVTLIAPPGHEETVLATFKRVAHGVNIRHFREQRLRKDGSLVDVSKSVFPLENPEGQVVGTCAIARDITADRQAELAGQSQQELYRRLVELSPEPVVVVSSGAIAFLDGAAVRPLGNRPRGVARADGAGDPRGHVLHRRAHVRAVSPPFVVATERSASG